MSWIDRIVAGTVAAGAMAVVGGFSSLAFAEEAPAAPAAPAGPAPRAALLGVPDVAWADAMAPAATPEADPAAAWRWARPYTVPAAG